MEEGFNKRARLNKQTRLNNRTKLRNFQGILFSSSFLPVITARTKKPKDKRHIRFLKLGSMSKKCWNKGKFFLPVVNSKAH
jgi:hypothetical protein